MPGTETIQPFRSRTKALSRSNLAHLNAWATEHAAIAAKLDEAMAQAEFDKAPCQLEADIALAGAALRASIRDGRRHRRRPRRLEIFPRGSNTVRRAASAMRESGSGNFHTLARVALEAAIRDEVDLIELLPEPKPSPSKLMALASWVTEVRKFRYLAGRLARGG